MASNLPFSDDVAERRFQRLTCPRQHPNLGVRRLARRRYPAGYTKTPGEGTEYVFPLSRRLSATGVGFLGILCPSKDQLSLRSAHPAKPAGTGRGFHVPHE